MFEFLTERSDANPHIALQCSFGPLTLDLRSGEDRTVATIDGQGIRFGPPGSSAADLVLSAEPAAWAELRKARPAPGFQTLATMRRARHLTVTGDMVTFYRHLLLLEMLFSPFKGGGIREAAPAAPAVEPVVGRYLRLSIAGRPHRVYFEEAGEGVPLLCLHTAGSDGRQYRHILNDPEVTDRFRVIAFDLPWHGKSSPPKGFEAEVYRLTTDSYVETVMAVADALELESPVVMGCSIGGRAVLHLALRHGSRFRAAIGLQSALYAEDRSLGDPLPEMALARPDIHAGMTAGASMAGMTAPQSPAAERWETMWHYMQGGPGIFAGDLHYYFEDGDLRNGGAAPLANSDCPIYLLSGDYDVSATPEMGRELAELIGAAHFEVMKGVGHFPMSENPEAFRGYLLPVLESILALPPG